MPRNTRAGRSTVQLVFTALPLSFRISNLNGQHGGIIHARKNMIVSDYLSGGLTYDQLEAAAFDYITFGDIALGKIRNGWGDVIGLEPLPQGAQADG